MKPSGNRIGILTERAPPPDAPGYPTPSGAVKRVFASCSAACRQGQRLINLLAVSLGLALMALPLSACGSDDTAPDYRYRLTVEVDTAEGLKAGSSVIEVEQRLVRPGSSPANTGVERRVRGEAVAVDLPGGKTLSALLRSDNNVNWASYVMQMLAPHIDSETFAQQLDNMLLLKGEIVLARTFPPVGHLKERSAYPMLVTFGAPDDPTSVERVDPDDLAMTFGEGISLGRITVQITDEPVPTGIEKRLEWLSEYPEPRLDPSIADRQIRTSRRASGTVTSERVKIDESRRFPFAACAGFLQPRIRPKRTLNLRSARYFWSAQFRRNRQLRLPGRRSPLTK